MERQTLKAIMEKDAADSGGVMETACGCGCLPPVQKTQKTNCQEKSKEGGK